MDDMERLMAYGLDYFDAELCVEVAQLDNDTLSILSHGIAVSKLIQDEDLHHFEGPLHSANNIQIMMLGLETEPICLN